MNALTVMHPDSPESLIPELPVDFEAEQALLGAVMMKASLVEIAAEIVRPEHFAHDGHIAIWSVIAEAYAENRIITPPGINARLKDDPAYIELGGGKYLMDLCGAVVLTLPGFVEERARRVADMWLRRRAMISLQEAAQMLASTSDDITGAALLEGLEVEIASITGAVTEKDRTEPIAGAVELALAAIDAAFKADGKLIGVTTGLVDLDARLGGLHNSDLVILAGRPSMGKTALGLTIAEAAARSGKQVAVFSLEMSREQLAHRSISAASGIEGARLRQGTASGADVARAVEAGAEIKALPIHIDDTGGLSVAQIRTRARRVKRKHGLSLIVIDYLQLMRGPGTGRGLENRVQEVSEITRGLKALAKELDVPILALSQLSRKVEDREDKRPQLADLRESGSIEQDADAVLFIYREQYYLERAEPNRRADESDDKFNARYASWERLLDACRNTAEVLIAKNRHGSADSVKAHFDGRLTKFSNLHQAPSSGAGDWHDR